MNFTAFCFFITFSHKIFYLFGKSKKLSLPIKGMSDTFNKQERLCSKKQMELLFSKGKSKLIHPVKLVWLKTPVDLKYPAQTMFVVPKRQFKKAKDRNKLKRRMREAYRLNKSLFYELLNKSEIKIIASFIFVGKDIEEYAVIEKAIIALQKIPFK
jgi:ribonuclease P protein component